ncbi:DNA damage-regulated autophagy modulator protein 1-like isoform X2 [Apis florea]|uniref:DNA damage-regulated autophagy modulator protein 1-like isoform X2 n=1 Tax=Apis florea TaxID=7463 RepID=UPI000629BBC3|nr:DNA damage-regulated autophagy modulator protein 1-like isoform X2 [Apis florea]
MLAALTNSRSKAPHEGAPLAFPSYHITNTYGAIIFSSALGQTSTRMPYGKLHVLPLSLFILIPVTFLITYTISVQWDHVVPGFPYISETGTLSPESFACCVYIRHRQVSQWQLERGNDLVSKRIVVVTAWCGVLACFGLDILANFQEARVVGAHMIGAMTCFTAGTIYFCLQTYLSHKMVPAVNGRVVVYIRAGLSVLTLILTIATIIPGYISMLEFQGNDYKKWLPTDGGWGWHVASAISEWVLAIVYCCFLLTFVPEFRLINFEDPVVTLIYLDKDQDLKLSHKLSSQVQES